MGGWAGDHGIVEKHRFLFYFILFHSLFLLPLQGPITDVQSAQDCSCSQRQVAHLVLLQLQFRLKTFWNLHQSSQPVSEPKILQVDDSPPFFKWGAGLEKGQDIIVKKIPWTWKDIWHMKANTFLDKMREQNAKEPWLLNAKWQRFLSTCPKEKEKKEAMSLYSQREEVSSYK